MLHGPLGQLREAACLAHTIPGTTLRLRARAGRSLLVSRHCLGADLDPCQLRAAMTSRTGEHMAVTIVDVELVAGLVDLGGGLYGRRADDGTDERWFVTELHPDHAARLIGACPLPAATPDSLHVVVKPDPDLRLCAVCLTATAAGVALDEVAAWALSACLVEELLVDVATEPTR